MCVSVNINGGQTPHTVTVERKASRRCVCQVFYLWEGINCWKITFAFFSEHLLDVSNIITCLLFFTSDSEHLFYCCVPCLLTLIHGAFVVCSKFFQPAIARDKNKFTVFTRIVPAEFEPLE